MKIRRAELLDAANVSVFVSQLSTTHIAPTLEDGGIENLLESMNSTNTAQRMRDGYPHWIAEEGTEIIGVAAVKPPSHLYHLFVATAHQRAGVGRLLLKKAVGFIVETHQCSTVSVNSSLNSIDAYRAYGFTSTADVQVQNGVRFQPMSLPTTRLPEHPGAEQDAGWKRE